MGKEEIQESEPLRIYLNEIGEIPLLDETEEKELGRRISDGDESARARLEEGNLRLVVSIATHYIPREHPFIRLYFQVYFSHLPVNNITNLPQFRFRFTEYPILPSIGWVWKPWGCLPEMCWW